ncbi:hypothetical protein E2320_009224, partial [Naja naja]
RSQVSILQGRHGTHTLIDSSVFLDAADLADISNHRKKVYFLSFCGAAVFDTATALLVPQSIKEVSWEALPEILSNHYTPSLLELRRAQVEGETISMYMAGLRTAELQCGFKELDDMLLDQLVCGVRDLRLQRHLLAKGDLTLKMAIEEAQAAEMSNLSEAEIQGTTSSPAAKPNATVHFEEFTHDFLDYGEDVNRLTNRQQLQQQRGWNSGNKPQQFPTAQAAATSPPPEGETISTYMAALRTAALQCGFKELDDMLLDQLVYGVRDLRLQRHLLAKGDLTLKVAIEEAQAAEMSNLSAAEIQSATSNPATKPNATIHFEELNPDEFLNCEEDINCLINHQQPQQPKG